MANKKGNNVSIKLNKKVFLEQNVEIIIKSKSGLRYLNKEGINSINDLLKRGKRTIIKMPGLSDKRSEEVLNTLHGLGLYFIDEKEYEKREVKELLDLEITYFDFSGRVYNALRRANIETVRDLLLYRIDDLQDLDCIGNVAIAEIINRVHAVGLLFPEENVNFFNGLVAREEIQKLTRYKELIVEREDLAQKLAKVNERIYTLEHIFDKRDSKNVK